MGLFLYLYLIFISRNVIVIKQNSIFTHTFCRPSDQLLLSFTTILILDLHVQDLLLKKLSESYFFIYLIRQTNQNDELSFYTCKCGGSK